ncbi:hypothetical protein G9P44_001281 [Scheffersomyces stipitis]|nr:hypothetical protein G9P44_001281 [Scheffersomyces stipitis]
MTSQSVSSSSSVRQRKMNEFGSQGENVVESEFRNAPVKLHPTSNRRLYFYHELDEWQQDNHFIRSGYVKETSSYRECVQSLTYFHNETVNIYSHLIPSSLVFWGVLIYVNFYLKIYDNYLGVWEKANFLQFAGACWFCLFMSSTFHCIKSHSHKISRFGNQLDYFGIVILITCSLNSIVMFAFYDHPYYRDALVAMFVLLGTICTIMTLHPKFSTSEYRPLRSTMFILFGLSGVTPVLLAGYTFGWKATTERVNVLWLVLEGLFYIGGAVLYALRVPERFTHTEEHETFHLVSGEPLPGRFDLIGHSHQIFHIMVVIAAFCHWLALVGCYHYLHQHILE